MEILILVGIWVIYRIYRARQEQRDAPKWRNAIEEMEREKRREDELKNSCEITDDKF